MGCGWEHVIYKKGMATSTVISTCAGHVLHAYHEQKQLRPQNVQVRSMSLFFLYWTPFLVTGATCCGFTYCTQNHNKRQKQAALLRDQQSLNQQIPATLVVESSEQRGGKDHQNFGDRGSV